MRALAAMLLVAACAPSEPAAPRANATCASCHATQSEAFAASAHARADATDLFRALRARADDGTRAFCDRCHAPHVVADERGVGCVTCHQALGTRGVSNGRLVRDDGPMRGPLDAPAPTPAHASERSGFVTSAELCGACHEVDGPGALVETPFSEWSRSPAGLRGVTCAGCHMASTPGNAAGPRPSAPAAEGGPSRALSDHAFVGPEHPRAPELLARAASIDVAVRARVGDALAVDVAVTNRNPGHALPSGARFAREVWVELSVRDARGAVHVVSGDLDAAAAPVIDPQRVDLGDLDTRDGMHALPFAANRRVVRAIPAGERRAYAFTAPAAFDGAAAVVVVARLRYRRNAWALRAMLGLPAAPDAPVDLARAEAAAAP